MKFSLVFYVGLNQLLDEGLSKINNNNAAEEFYLTDLISIINEKGYKIKTYEASNNEVKRCKQQN